MPKFNLRAVLPHLAAIAIFLCLIFAYFPELLDKKSLRMDDIEQHKGMSNELADYRERTGEEAVWTNAMFGGMPGYTISVVYYGNLVGHLGTVLRLGLPRPADQMFILMLGTYILLLILRVRPPLAVIGAAAYCFSTYNLLIMEAGHMSKVNAISWMPWAFAGICLLFNGRVLAGTLMTALFMSLHIKASHFQMTYYFGFIIVFYTIAQLIHAIRNKTVPGFVKASAGLVIAGLFGVITNVSSLYTIYDYGKDSIRGKSELTIKEHKDEGGLDKNYALDYSYGVGEIFSYMIPNVYGGASNIGLSEQKDALKKVDDRQQREIIAQLPQYWSDTSTTGPFYAGALICFLSVLGFFIVKHPIRWAILGVSLLAVLLSWGKNFEDFSVFMLNHFPLYNKFRAVKTTLVITDFLLPLMAILALNEVIKDPGILKRKQKAFIAAFVLTGGLCLLFFLIPGMFFHFDYLNSSIEGQLRQMLARNGLNEAGAGSWLEDMKGNLETVRMAVFKADALRAFLFIAAGAVLLWFYSRSRFNPLLLAVIVAALVIGDLFNVNKRYVNKKDFIANSRAEIPFDPSPADEAVFAEEIRNTPSLKASVDAHVKEGLARKTKRKGTAAAEQAKHRFRGLLANTNYRVLNLTGRAGIFNDAATSFFHKSVGGYSAVKLERYQEFIEFHLDSTIRNLYGILNNRLPDSLMSLQMKRLSALNMLNTRYIIYNPEAPPLVNPQALGNAWFVSSIREVASADEEITALYGLDPSETALVDQRFGDQLRNWQYTPDSTASIRLDSYAPNKLIYSSASASEQMAVFSEIYYAKGWNAYIDGNPAPHFRTNYILRGMKVPAGKHAIEFRFEPQTYYTTEKIGYASSGLLLLVTAGFIVYTLRRKKPGETEPTQQG